MLIKKLLNSTLTTQTKFNSTPYEQWNPSLLILPSLPSLF